MFRLFHPTSLFLTHTHARAHVYTCTYTQAIGILRLTDHRVYPARGKATKLRQRKVSPLQYKSFTRRRNGQGSKKKTGHARNATRAIAFRMCSRSRFSLSLFLPRCQPLTRHGGNRIPRIRNYFESSRPPVGLTTRT